MTRPGSSRTAIVLFTRDLRVHDQRGLAEAARTSDRLAPLFVLDDRLLGALEAPNRIAFLVEALVAPEYPRPMVDFRP